MADEDIKRGEFVIEYVGEGDILVVACSSSKFLSIFSCCIIL